ncbi:MAG: HAD hydrolase-like protein [Candidatus Shapirobacteria bacterium]|jgi:FMN phosphatase YigB (HAD superfamily)|nr:HAD hydrolase-like protein [Candidatus Shapirobacteria bacterium]
MQVESFHLSPVEKELRFDNWRRKNNIQLFLLDLDDTLSDTQSVFSTQISKACDYLAKNSPLLESKAWEKQIRSINDIFFEQYGVNPNRWNQVVDTLSEKYLLRSEVSLHTKEIFQDIYTTPLQFKTGAKEGLDFLKKTDTPFAIVTHANTDWTWRKYEYWLKLDRYLVDWDDVFIVDENGHKTAESWQEALNYFKIKANNCAIVGDSPRSDINPATSIGIRHSFFVNNPDSWSIHQQEIPQTTIIINNLSEIANIDYQHLTDIKPRKTIY